MPPTNQRILTLAALLMLLPPCGFAQGDTPARIKSRTELVVVPVTVKDSRGNLVPDVRRDEFRIFEDGVEQQIAIFSAEVFPLSAVVLIDNDLPLKMSEQVQRSLMAIAAGFSSADEVALMKYANFPEPVLDFTSDNDKIFTQLKRMRLASNFPGEGSAAMTAGPKINEQSAKPGVPDIGGTKQAVVTTSLTDAVYAAGQMLRDRGRDRRKIIFLISNGANGKNRMTYEETIQLLLSGDISVYSIADGSSLPLLKQGTSLLAKYATATGGDSFYASKQRDLERLYAKVAEEARTQNTIANAPQNPAGKKEYHSIDVRIRRPNLNLLARQGYYTTVPH